MKMSVDIHIKSKYKCHPESTRDTTVWADRCEKSEEGVRVCVCVFGQLPEFLSLSMTVKEQNATPGLVVRLWFLTPISLFITSYTPFIVNVLELPLRY